MLDAKALGEAVERRVCKANVVARATDRQHAQSARAARVDHGPRFRMIGGDDGRAVGRDKLGEQPQLGGEIVFDGRVIVHVVSAEIGERRDPHAHAVEAMLIETVRGGLQRQMRDALARDVVERPVQRDRIGRRQRPVDGARRTHQTDRPDAGRGMAEPCPYLARESRDRRLAAGAGHGRDHSGLRGMETGGRERQRPPRIGDADNAGAGMGGSLHVADDGRRARRPRLADESRAVRPGAGQREKDVALRHSTGVHAKSARNDPVA